MPALLSVNNLEVIIASQQASKLVSEVNFELFPGQTLSLIGESGSGKTLTALSIMQLLPANLYNGKTSQILYQNQDILNLAETKLRKIRGKEIAIIFQEPMTALNPIQTIGDQIEEVLKVHEALSKSARTQEVLRLLEMVQLRHPSEVYDAYIHELSGGMRQRAMIAMSLAAKPKILIADEPTTALDVTIQSDILKLLKSLQAQFNLSLLFITHDLNLVRNFSDDVAVMKSGKIVEQGEFKKVYQHPTEAYTRHLFSVKPQEKIREVEENLPPVLTVENLKVYFPIKRGFFKRTLGYFKAVDEVSLTILPGETMALVGESGCGKTTLAKTILGLIPRTSGQIFWDKTDIGRFGARRLRKKRQEVQIIFQDPFSALDPRMTVFDIIQEGMKSFKIGPTVLERRERVETLLKQVGLKPEHLFRYPHQFSGGERQRICIARALAVSPKLIVLDEPTSSLDVSIQAEIIDLLIRLQKDLQVSYLFITHNLSIVPFFAHRTAVMLEGKIVETGDTQTIFNHPLHPFTQKLLAASKNTNLQS